MGKLHKSCASFFFMFLTAILPFEARGQVVPPPDFNPLNQIPIPEPPNLPQFVKNEPAAVRLGKALFWDMQVGSDGVQACGTCHFSHGADTRVKNQLSPGLNAGDTLFGNNTLGLPDFPLFEPNYTLQPEDFPLHQIAAPADDADSAALRSTNDVVSSQGVRLSQFVDVVQGSPEDSVAPLSDPVFQVGGVNTRRVEPRNTPTVINAIFNFTNFWDGRANFLFNGENPFGPADANAGVWFNDPVDGLVKQAVEMQFASLASQAVGPPLSDFEMSAQGRTFPRLGRKLLSLRPLNLQLVHPGDSQLGALSRATLDGGGNLTGQRGLNTTYIAMIQQAFQNNLWDSAELTPAGFSQMEANFALFFGLAIQLYEATLVADDTPLDRWLAGDPNAITDQQKEGFNIFNNNFCAECHGGIEFTNASVSASGFINNLDTALIEIMFVFDGTQVIYDNGFNNTGVTPTTDDLSRGGTAPFINPLTGDPFPLSFSRLAELQAQNLLPFETPIMDPNLPPDFPTNANGLFKVPGLRNVELTAPYFHNGSLMTLEEVVDFYIRGGNFPETNSADLDPLVGNGLPSLRGNQDKKDALVAFLMSLTDERVRNAQAPFDHPEIFIPEGDPEVLTRIPATDGDGLTPDVSPVAPILTSTPVTVAVAGQLYLYDVNGFDPNGDVVIYQLLIAPAGMTIDSATGLIAWTPESDGVHSVSVRAQDPGALSGVQNFTLTVGEPPPIETTACGDGVIQTAAGGGCDDGNSSDGAGCSGLCEEELSEVTIEGVEDIGEDDEDVDEDADEDDTAGNPIGNIETETPTATAGTGGCSLMAGPAESAQLTWVLMLFALALLVILRRTKLSVKRGGSH